MIEVRSWGDAARGALWQALAAGGEGAKASFSVVRYAFLCSLE